MEIHLNLSSKEFHYTTMGFTLIETDLDRLIADERNSKLILVSQSKIGREKGVKN